MGNKTNIKNKKNSENEPNENMILDNIYKDEIEEDENEKNIIINESLFIANDNNSPIPESKIYSFDSDKLNIPKIKEIIKLNDEIIINAEDIVYCEKFSKLKLFDCNYKENIKKIQNKKNIELINKNECLTIITYYIKENKISIGTSNGDIQKLSKRYNDLISNKNN